MLSLSVAPRSWACAAVCVAALATATPSQAADDKVIPGDFTGTVGFLTDYTFRGISQTDSKPAVQAGLEWSYSIIEPLSFYAGIWGSNVDFDDGDQGQPEVDLRTGLRGTVGSFSWQGGVIYYYYPGAKVNGDQYDYWEIMGKVGYDFGFLAVSGNINYSPDYFFETGNGVFLGTDVTVPLPFAEKFKPAITAH